MKVLFYLADQNPHRDRSRGITVYTEGLLSRLAARPEVEVTSLGSRSSMPGPDACLGMRRLRFRTDHVVGRLVADQLHPWLLRPEVDLWHYPKGFLPLLTRPRVPAVGTVCDTIADWYATHYPKSRSRAGFAYWSSMLERALRRFDRVLTLSETSRRSIEEFCERRDIAAPAIDVVGVGARWEDAVPRTVKKDDRVVHLASPLPHKGTDGLLDWWLALEREQRELPRLELIGAVTPEQRGKARRLRGVELSPPLPEAALREHLESALALLLPSEIEGFGLPALEAYYLGTPVVYAQETAVEEVLGSGTPGGFQLGSFDSFAVALEEVLTIETDDIRSRADSLRSRFSWSHCVDCVVESYGRALCG